jgi:hypothetical protein
MAGTAVVLGAVGLILTFAPDVALSSINAELNTTTLLLMKFMGGLYLGYAVMNWMTKESLIGGIYNRPIAIANFWHFFVAGLLIKALIVNPDLPWCNMGRWSHLRLTGNSFWSNIIYTSCEDK